MKILKVSGIVVGLHLFAFVLLLAIPGCNSTSHPAALSAPTAPAAATVIPLADAAPAGGDASAPDSSAPMAPGGGGAPVFYPPTRPGSPAAQALVGQPAPENVTPASTYEVKRGDSLGRIARQHHLTVAALAKANHLRLSSVLRVGQKLIIPGGSMPAEAGPGEEAAPEPPAPAPAEAAPPSGRENTYVVKSGDRLSTIAHRFGLTTGQLAAANNIANPKLIRPGQTLVIPAGHGGHGSRKSAPEAAAPAPAPAPTAPAESTGTEPAPSGGEPAPVVPVNPAPSSADSSAAVPVIPIPSDNSK